MRSNWDKGATFSERVRDYLKGQRVEVLPEYGVQVGMNSQQKKMHNFDLGNDTVLIECKAYS